MSTDELAACFGKSAYATYNAANRTIQAFRRDRRRSGRHKVEIYHCHHCGMWHLGGTR